MKLNNIIAPEINPTKNEQIDYSIHATVEWIVYNIDFSTGKFGDSILHVRIHTEKTDLEGKTYIEHIRVSTRNQLIVEDFRKRCKVGQHIIVTGNIHFYKKANPTSTEKYWTIEPKAVFFGEEIEGMKESFENYKAEKTAMHQKNSDNIFGNDKNSSVISY